MLLYPLSVKSNWFWSFSLQTEERTWLWSFWKMLTDNCGGDHRASVTQAWPAATVKQGRGEAAVTVCRKGPSPNLPQPSRCEGWEGFSKSARSTHGLTTYYCSVLPCEGKVNNHFIWDSACDKHQKGMGRKGSCAITMHLLSHLLEQELKRCASRKVWTNTEKVLEKILEKRKKPKPLLQIWFTQHATSAV